MEYRYKIYTRRVYHNIYTEVHLYVWDWTTSVSRVGGEKLPPSLIRLCCTYIDINIYIYIQYVCVYIRHYIYIRMYFVCTLYVSTHVGWRRRKMRRKNAALLLRLLQRHIYICRYIHVCIHVYIYIYYHVYKSSASPIYICIYVYIYVFFFSPCTYTMCDIYVYIYIYHVYKYVQYPVYRSLALCKYVHVCTSIYALTDVYVYICLRTHIYMYADTWLCMCVYTSTRMCRCMYASTRVGVHIYICIYIYMINVFHICIRVWYMDMHTGVWMQVYAGTHTRMDMCLYACVSLHVHGWTTRDVCTYMYVYIYIYMYVGKDVYIYMYINIYIHLHWYILTRMYTNPFTCAFTYAHPYVSCVCVFPSHRGQNIIFIGEKNKTAHKKIKQLLKYM
jgi:hypothetical protein